ncbi:hypothetical protein [Salinivibrio socompensis]|nr:hypothetical protein [Salinivibrio socompensis]
MTTKKTETTKVVEFLKAWRVYVAKDVAQFDAHTADELIKAGIAKAAK